MPATSELVAADRSVEEVARLIGADWLVYQDLEDLVAACQHDDAHIEEFDTSCFSGEYVTGDVTPEYLERLQLERSDAAKSLRRERRGKLKVIRAADLAADCGARRCELTRSATRSSAGALPGRPGQGRRACAPCARALDASRHGPVWVAAVGKAASAMTLGAHDASGTSIERALVITKDGHVLPQLRAFRTCEIHESAHPVPDERSLAAGESLLRWVARAAGGRRAAVPDLRGRLQSRGSAGGGRDLRSSSSG